MSNLGFRLAMEREGIHVIETAVGDRYVLEAMRAGGYVLGGEQSGHVVMLDHATTGDGVLTALTLLGRMATTGRSLADLVSVMDRLPQVLVNVSGVDRARVDSAPALTAAVADAETGSADADASCCGPAAPSRSSASWSRRRPRTSPARWPASSPKSYAPSSP